MEYPVIDMIQTGKNIRDLRIKNTVTVERLAEDAGVSSQAVFRWQNGKSLPTLDNMLFLAEYFGVHVEDIVAFSKSPTTLKDNDFEIEL